jgi:TetR/AcrR family transcriptional repressor of nem operon
MKAVKQPRALATRDRILDEASRLFALKGYHDTKLEEVLGAATVTSGAFFHHFAGKEDLAFAVLDRHMEKRRQLLDEIEERLDAIQTMVRQRQPRKGGCIIGNLSTALSDTHDGFRRRLAQCFDEMARELEPHLAAAGAEDARALARYIVAIVEGSIMLTRTHQDRHMMAHHFDYLKAHLRQAVGARDA